MPHNCRGTCIFQPMTRLTKIDTLSYLIKEPKPVTPVQVPKSMRASKIVFRSQTGQAYYPTEPSHVLGWWGLAEAMKKIKKKTRKKNKRGGGGEEKSNITCKPVNSKSSPFFWGKINYCVSSLSPFQKALQCEAEVGSLCLSYTSLFKEEKCWQVYVLSCVQK